MFSSGPTLALADKMSDILRLILSMKPTVDAVFTLLFMGEYRQYTINFCKWLRAKLTCPRAATEPLAPRSSRGTLDVPITISAQIDISTELVLRQ